MAFGQMSPAQWGQNMMQMAMQQRRMNQPPGQPGQPNQGLIGSIQAAMQGGDQQNPLMKALFQPIAPGMPGAAMEGPVAPGSSGGGLFPRMGMLGGMLGAGGPPDTSAMPAMNDPGRWW